MFSKSIVCSSQFLRMPATSRLLYYDLGMAADDDGYCEWYPIIAMTGAKEQDLEVLKANNFIYIFDSNILIIKDWKENNLIRSDRYTPSKHIGKYENIVGIEMPDISQITEMTQSGIPSDNQMDTQVRLGKVRLDKVNTPHSKMSEEDFTTFWNAYPKHKEKKTTYAKFLKIDKGHLPTILSALEEQKNSEQWKKDGGQFIPYPSTWINKERWTDETPKLSEQQEMEQFARECLIKAGGDHDQAVFYFAPYNGKYKTSDLNKVRHIIHYWKI